MKPAIAFLVVALSYGIASSAALDLPVRRAGSEVMPSPAYLGDRLTLQLTPAATRHLLGRPVRFPTRALGLSSLDNALASLGALQLEPAFRGEVSPPQGSGATDFTAFYLVRLPAEVQLEEALERLRAAPEVAHVSPIGVAPVSGVPNDSLWSLAWWFHQPSRRDIHALEAWEVTRGDSSLIVALLDTGLIPYHPDIGGTIAGRRGQIWTNAAEAQGTAGVDDDGNGFTDDEWGWDFVSLSYGVGITPGEDWSDADGDPNDFVGHGTTVAGLIGAITDNGIGITGTAWQLRIMPLRVGWSEVERQTGVISMFYLAQAVRYATRMGAHVINLSTSTTPYFLLDLAVDEAIRAGITVVVAAGNNGLPAGLNPRPGVIYVTATDRNDQVPVWANRGLYVDLAAPGADLATTTLRRPGSDSLGLRQPHYNHSVNGTSFAAPIVSGAVVLVQSVRRAQDTEPLLPEMVHWLLTATSDDISDQNPGLDGYGAGRLNVARAMPEVSFLAKRGPPDPSVGPMVSFETHTGQRQLALATQGGKLLFLDAATLDSLGGAPLGLDETPLSGFAAADLGGGRGLGLFASLSSLRIGGWSAAGTPLLGWPVLGVGHLGAPALGDVDGDGSLDIVSAAREGSLWVWNAFGRLLPGFPMNLPPVPEVRAAVALSDLDGLPGVEILVVQWDGTLHAVRAGGTELPGWPVRCDIGQEPAGPVVARGAEGPVVVVASRTGITGILPDGGCSFRTEHTPGELPFDPAIADLDGDGVEEVVVATPVAMRAYDLSGSLRWLWTSSRPLVSMPLLVQLRADPSPEILVANTSTFLALSAAGIPDQDLSWLGPTAPYPTAAGPFGPGSTRVLAGVVFQSLFVAFDGDPGSWSSGPTPWGTQRGNQARTGSSLYAPPMSPGDGVAPLAIGDLQATAAGPSLAWLRWTAPSDGGAQIAQYEVRHSALPIAPENVLSAALASFPRPPASPGSRESLLVDNLPVSAPRYFVVRSRGTSGSWSRISNLAMITTGPPDRDPPAPIGDLQARVAGGNSVWLSWTAPSAGDTDRVTHYDLRFADHSITPSNFSTASPVSFPPSPASPGTRETLLVRNLPASQRFFAIRSRDVSSNWSDISNVAEARIPSSTPDPVQDLRIVAASETTLTLRWTASGEDEWLGRPRLYSVRASSRGDPYPVAEHAWTVLATVDAGSPESLVAGPLQPATTYRVRLIVVDHQNNSSSPSNLVIGTTLTSPSPEPSPSPSPEPGLGVRLATRNPTTLPALFHWRFPEGVTGSRSIRIHDAAGRVRRRIVLEAADQGIASWDGADERGNRLGSGLYFASLVADRVMARTRFVLLRR